MSLLRHSRIAATLTKIALPLKAIGGAIWRNKMPIAGTALVAGMTGAGVSNALNRSRAGATPEWVEYSRNRGVPAAPKF
jgi:hypothetical protein